MANLIEFIPWRALLIAGALSLVAFWSYSQGYEKATLESVAKLEKMEKERALALAQAESQARVKLEKAVKTASELEDKLRLEREARETEKARLIRRINDVSKIADNTCTGLPAEWVREYNRAFGADSCALPGYAGSAEPDGAACSNPGAVSGLSQEPLTSPADVLAHATVVGAELQKLKGQVNGWIDTYQNWKGLSDER